jgi:hypothetical protein
VIPWSSFFTTSGDGGGATCANDGDAANDASGASDADGASAIELR